jgi:hypothetical protein
MTLPGVLVQIHPHHMRGFGLEAVMTLPPLLIDIIIMDMVSGVSGLHSQLASLTVGT